MSGAQATPAGKAGALRVTNLKGGEVVRHPLVLLRGDTEAGATRLDTRRTHPKAGVVIGKSLVRKGAFKALVELAPGVNVIELKSDRSGLPARLTLTYTPQTNERYVRLIWLADSTGATEFAAPVDGFPQTYEARLRTAALLMQSFTAERMHEMGYGRRTFNLELDAQGQPVVHTIKAPETAKYYQELTDDMRFWGEINHFINTRHRDNLAKNMVLASFTRKNPTTGKMMAHTALGGGNLGLFGSASVFSWPESVATIQDAFLNADKVDPTRVHDDSAGRGVWWALASTTIGAALHEMGHTFDLPHTQDSRDIMTRGFDRLNRFFTLHEPPPGSGGGDTEYAPDEEGYFAAVSASSLRWSPWFALDRQRIPDGKAPELSRKDTASEVVITSKEKLVWIGLWEKDTIRTYKEYPDQPRRIVLTPDDIKTLMGDRPASKIVAMDEFGRKASLKLD